MAEVISTPEPAPGAGSPPPNCAICLGPCTNKCFSNSCMHQFCFKCLLEWSKIKAVCPLCKQPFTSILHNVKPNNEYDIHYIERPEPMPTYEDVNLMDMFLPPAPPSRHFQFRTTFTVDPRGELAIQQMLLTHPLTSSVIMPGYGSAHTLSRHNRYRRRDVSSTNFRRSVYANNLWVCPSDADVTGRYRDVTPQFYRDNPAARNRLVPWLNRELNALLFGNTQQMMQLVDIIMGQLSQHHIRSRYFRNLLEQYLENKTDHFVHEFYFFMRSPFDMIGYDQHVIYLPRTQNEPVEIISDPDSDSDVAIVSVSNLEEHSPFGRRPTLEVIEITSSDGSVILVESDEEGPVNLTTNNNANRANSDEERRNTLLPIKIRFKRKLQSRERRKNKRKRWTSSSPSVSSTSDSSSSTSSFTSSTSTSSTSSSSSSSSESAEYVRPRKPKKFTKRSRHKERKSHKKSKPARRRETLEVETSDDEPLLTRQRRLRQTDSEDTLPLSSWKCKLRKKKELKRDQQNYEMNSSRESVAGPSSVSESVSTASTGDYRPYMSPRIPTQSYYGTTFDHNYICESNEWVPLDFSKTYEPQEVPKIEGQTVSVKNEVGDSEYYAGPSNSCARLRSVIVKKENTRDLWYSRPANNLDSSDED